MIASAQATDLLHRRRRHQFRARSHPRCCASWQALTGCAGHLDADGPWRLSGRPIRQWLGMLGMHGTYEANMAMHGADVIVAIGARFDDRVTGRLDAFSPQLEEDPHRYRPRSSINKTVRADLASHRRLRPRAAAA